MDPEQKRDERQFRQVEKALLYIDDAARQVGRIAAKLEADGGDPHLVTVLREASTALRDDHRQAMKRVYFRAPTAEG
jgi:hypothetical protein